MPEVSLPVSLARRVRRSPPSAGRCRVVAVDGPSGAGKTTLADALGHELGAQVVHVDDLIPGWDGLTAGPGIVARDILQPLTRGEDGGYLRYDWVEGRYAEWQPVPQADHLVLDGCGSGARAIAVHLALLVWVDADREVRFERGIARDGETFRPHWTAWEQASQTMFAAEDTAARADVRVTGSSDD